jgi:hypothetical protein
MTAPLRLTDAALLTVKTLNLYWSDALWPR